MILQNSCKDRPLVLAFIITMASEDSTTEFPNAIETICNLVRRNRIRSNVHIRYCLVTKFHYSCRYTVQGCEQSVVSIGTTEDNSTGRLRFPYFRRYNEKSRRNRIYSLNLFDLRKRGIRTYTYTRVLRTKIESSES